MDQVRMTVLVPADLRRQAKIMAAAQNVTISEVVRAALEQFVQQAESRQTMLASEAVLRREWDTPEEDAAWADL